MEVMYFENARHVDSRGEFRRIYDSGWRKLQDFEFRQTSISKNPKSHTLRGMHYQTSGPPEHKLITVLSGSVHMVVSNAHLVSKSSEIKNQYFSISDASNASLFVPSGLATGWISLSDNVMISYMMTARFQDCEFSGFCFNDTFAKIQWPMSPKLISEKDLNWQSLK